LNTGHNVLGIAPFEMIELRGRIGRGERRYSAIESAYRR
jgi:hypothetical protein